MEIQRYCFLLNGVNIYLANVYVCVYMCVPYCAVSLDVGSFQGDGDAVEEDENQNHMVKQFVRDHALAPHTASEVTCTRVGY